MSNRFRGLRPWSRHGLILVVAGFLYVLVGFQYMLAPPSAGRNSALKVILEIAPLQVWGGLFILAGLLSIVSSRWPPMSNAWGYMVLAGLSAGWAATHLTGILFFHAPGATSTQVILWGCLGFMWWAISGLLNPDKTAVAQYEEL